MKLLKTRRHAGRLACDILAVLAGAAGLVFLTWVFSFGTRFYPNTYIDGVDCSGLDAKEAVSELTEAAEGRSVCIVDGSDEVIGSIPLAGLMPSPEMLTDAVKEMIAGQLTHPDLESMLGKCRSDHRIPWPDGDALLTPVENAVGDWTGAEAVDSEIRMLDGRYVITDAACGIKADAAACAAALAARLREGDVLSSDVVSVAIKTRDIEPGVGQNDAALLKIKGEIDALTARDITLNFGDGIQYTLTPEDILSVYDITLTDDDMRARLNKEAVYTLFDSIASGLPCDGTERKYYPMLRGENTHYNEWDKGFILDRGDMERRLWAQLVIGESGTVHARYDYTSSCDAKFDVGDSFIEISIENQFMWVYKDGNLMVATPIVSGNASKGNATPTGVFMVSYTQKNTWLYGRGYSYHVDYWVPFFGNYGIHDAWWVSEYGGDIYLTDGSHGCVNTPLEAMAIVCENCAKYTPVVVY